MLSQLLKAAAPALALGVLAGIVAPIEALSLRVARA